MLLADLFFYLFALMTIGSGVMVVCARNPVHAVLFLILAFFNSAGLFVLMGAEFIAMLIVVVYVGAVAVLFLFVVMMLDITPATLKQSFRRHLPLSLLIGFILLVELITVFSSPQVRIGVASSLSERTNTEQIGDILYTEYLLVFQLAGLILLVAMIGAITLTMRHREGVKRQVPSKQNARLRDEAITVVSVESGVAPQALLAGGDDKKRKAVR